jgi:uncharacterized repeat protein (TIGR03803 family)
MKRTPGTIPTASGGKPCLPSSGRATGASTPESWSCWYKNKTLATGFALALVLVAMLVPAGAWAQTETVLHRFAGPEGGGSGADASQPSAPMIRDAAGNLYGTTESGGTFGVGTVFEMVNSSGSYAEKVLYSFGNADGANPIAGLVMDGAGNLYGTTLDGGTSGDGTVFELTKSSNGYTESVLYNFTGVGGDGGGPHGGLVMDAKGNLYGTTAGGGTSDLGVVFELVNSSGVYTEKVLYRFTGSPDGATPWAGVILDSAGNLFGTTRVGGANSFGTVFELVNSSGSYAETVLYSFGGAPDGGTPVAGLVMDAAGNLEGTTQVGGTSNFGTAFELVYSRTAGTYTEKLLHSFEFSGTDGIEPMAGLATDSAGNLYGTTPSGGAADNGSVFELVNSSGNYTEQVVYSFGGQPDGSYPVAGLAMDAANNLYGTTQSGGTTTGYGTVFEIKRNATGPTVTLSASSLDLGSVVVGSSTSAKSITVTNSGGADLTFAAGAVTISGTNSADFSISADTCSGATVAAGNTCWVSVVFTPSIVGSESAALNFADNAADSPQTVSLSGTGLAQNPAATLSPTNLTFTSQVTGTTSTAQTVTLMNSGNAALSIASIAASTNFGETNNCGTSVASASSCTIRVTFAPAAIGSLTGTLSVADNAANSPQTVSLSGAGVAAPAATLSPASLTFQAQAVGTASAVQTITLTNSGGANLTFSVGAVSVSGADGADFAISTDTCGGQTIAPNKTCAVGITFKPSLAGSESAKLSIADNAANSPQTVNLSGTGVVPNFSLAASGSSSATVSAGGNASYSVNISPSGGFNQSVALTCAGAPAEAACTITPTSVMLNGSATVSATVSVATTASAAGPAIPHIPTVPRRRLVLTFAGLLMFLLLAWRVAAEVPSANGKQAPWRPMTAAAGLLLAAALLVSCGQGTARAPSNPGTPAGTYTLTVTGTSGTLSHSANLSLTVQ